MELQSRDYKKARSDRAPTAPKIKNKNKIKNKIKNKNNTLKDECEVTQFPWLVLMWNEHSDSLTKVVKMNDTRVAKINKHFKELSEAQWLEAIQNVAANDFCKGNNDRGWTANFDWFLGKDKNGQINYVKALEGVYSGMGKGRPRTREEIVSQSNLELYQKIENMTEEEYANFSRQSNSNAG